MKLRNGNKCRKGHEYTHKNTYLYKGHRFCRTCRNTSREKWMNILENKSKVGEYNKKYTRNHARKYGKTYYQNHREKVVNSIVKYNKANPEKKNAHSILNKAIRSKKVARSPCEVCGNIKSEGHHEDYSKPLEVIWLCRIHHREKHRKVLTRR